MARILVPLPDCDFDVTEVSVPWKLLSEAGHEVVFSTEKGAKPAADPRLLSGVLFGQLGAEPEPKAFYREMEGAAAFEHPVAWSDVNPDDYAALLLAGGHAPGMKQYLEGEPIFRWAVRFAQDDTKLLAAICHGVVVLARSKDPSTGKSVLAKRRTTCLPKYMEKTAWMITSWKLGRYYRTYPAYVEEEVTEALDDPQQFVRGPRVLTRRGTRDDDSDAFVVEDGNYISARWPGDAYLFGKKLAHRLTSS